MKAFAFVAAVAGSFLFSCGIEAGDVPDEAASTAAQISRNSCASHTDSKSCGADTADRCTWYINTRACALGQICPAGFCSAPPAPTDGGIGSGETGTVGTSTGKDAGVPSGGGGGACSCPNGGVCYEQVGGPALQGSGPQIVCKAVPSTCKAADVCQCFVSSPIEHCAASTTVGGLCVCDNGIR